jgi:uncharacterized integral membrane protein (TIGR00697 family)
MNKTLTHDPKALWFLMMAYTVTILLANWFDMRLLQLGPVIIDAGTIIFPLSFVVADVITEVYGYKETRRAIWCGFLFNLLFLGYGALITHLPSPANAPYNSAFDSIMTMAWRIIFASMISYFCGEPLNAYLMAKLKLAWQGRLMAVRFVSSTLIASLVDSALFTFIAFYRILPLPSLYQLALTMWGIKIIIELLVLPISLSLARYLKKLEKRDVFDQHTQFALWHWEADYSVEDNRIDS